MLKNVCALLNSGGGILHMSNMDLEVELSYNKEQHTLCKDSDQLLLSCSLIVASALHLKKPLAFFCHPKSTY